MKQAELEQLARETRARGLNSSWNELLKFDDHTCAGSRVESIDKKAGQRSTAQRQLIQDILQHAERHLDADEIYQRARQRLPGVSLSTVYRNLRLLKEQGLVEEHQLGGMRRYYESALNSEHHHMVCLACGRIFEFTCPSTEKLKSRVKKEQGFEVTNVDVRFAGYCPECQRRLRDNLNKGENTRKIGGK